MTRETALGYAVIAGRSLGLTEIQILDLINEMNAAMHTIEEDEAFEFYHSS